MLSRTQTLALLILVTFLLVIWRPWSSSSAAPSDDKGVEHPPPSHVFRQRLVAVGDLHGDIDNAKRVLRRAGIIDDWNDWIGGTDILVQTGDIVDRGTHAGGIYRLMRKLRGQAAGQGGEVVSILGNHEVMNAIGDWRYVTQDDIRSFGSVEKRMHDMSVDGWLGQEWLANYSTTAKVSLGPFAFSPSLSFTHGSLRPSYDNLLPYPEKINELGHSLLTRALTPPMAPPHPPNPYSGLPRGTTPEEMDLYSAGGPYWWRGLAEVQDDKVVCQWAEELKEKLGVRRIVGGHTPNFQKIVDRCNGSIIIIDTGISSAYGGVLSALEVVYTLTPKDKSIPPPDHRQDPLSLTSTDLKGTFVESEEVHAVYAKRKHLIAVDERTVTL